MNLADWLEANLDYLIEAATGSLAQSDALAGHVSESVEAFFTAFLLTAQTNSQNALNGILEDWVRSSSAPTEQDPTGGLSTVWATLKHVTWEQVQLHAEPREAMTLFIDADQIYTAAAAHLTTLEAGALLRNMRRELDEAYDHIARVDRSKSNFIAVAAHELRTPLTLIEGYTDIIRNQSSALMQSKDSQELFDGIAGGISRLREIINDMIQVSRIELDMLEIRFQPTLLHRVLDAIVRDTQRPLGERRLTLVVEWDTIPEDELYADPERLHQVFQKVVLNAIKYTPDGGEIVISGRGLQNFTDLMVIDNGIGIAPDDLPHVFEAFSSLGDVALHSSSKTKFKGGGPGLGLFIARGIMEAHGGTIWAESPGHDEETLPGSTFHIMIPMHSDKPTTELMN